MDAIRLDRTDSPFFWEMQLMHLERDECQALVGREAGKGGAGSVQEFEQGEDVFAHGVKFTAQDSEHPI